MIRNYCVLCTALLVALAMPYSLEAQTCFRAKPLPDCKSFWVTEISVGIEIAAQRDAGFVSPEVGLMLNLNKKHAVGGTGFLDIGDMTGFGVKGRYRYWMSKNFTIDAGVGGKISETWSVLADASFVYGGWIGIGGRLETWGGANPETVGYATAKLGDWPAVGATGVLAVVGAIAVAIAWIGILGAG